jgi:hypothetical protein
MKKTITLYIVTAIPLAIILGGIYWALTIQATLKDYKKTKGEVVELKRKARGVHDPDRDVIYYPQIRYYDGQDRVYVLDSKIGSERPRLEEGDEIELLVSRKSPHDAVINSFFHLWLGPTLLLGTGAVLFIVLVLMRVRKGET